MSEQDDQVPVYRTVRVGAQEDTPAAAIADVEAWEARKRYPQLVIGGGPIFGVAEEMAEGAWKIHFLGEQPPQTARDGLASIFRLHARTAEEAGDAAVQEEFMAAAEILDWEARDEMTVRGTRFRIIRGDQFIRMGPDGPEPPRPSDPDPAKSGHGYRNPDFTKGFVIDPFVVTGMSQGILRLELLAMVFREGTVPDDVREDSQAATVTHPGGVLLPAEFMTVEYDDGDWLPRSVSSATPQSARDGLAMYLRVMAPVSEHLDDEETARYAAIADRIDRERPDEIDIDGRTVRVVRVERLVRIGPDGPEPPRPSDYDPAPPPAVHTKQLIEQGVLSEDPDSDDFDYDADPRRARLVELLDKERLRQRAADEARDAEG